MTTKDAAMGTMSVVLIVAGIWMAVAGTTVAELTPPYFNLAEGRHISATATCGVDIDKPELYCKLVGANTENYNHSRKLIQGQVSVKQKKFRKILNTQNGNVIYILNTKPRLLYKLQQI